MAMNTLGSLQEKRRTALVEYCLGQLRTGAGEVVYPVDLGRGACRNFRCGDHASVGASATAD